MMHTFPTNNKGNNKGIVLKSNNFSPLKSLNIKTKVILLTLLLIYLPGVSLYLGHIYINSCERESFRLDFIEQNLAHFEESLENEATESRALLEKLALSPIVLNYLSEGQLEELRDYLSDIKSDYSLDILDVYHSNKKRLEELHIGESSFSLSIGRPLELSRERYYIVLNTVVHLPILASTKNIALLKSGQDIPVYNTLNSSKKSYYVAKRLGFQRSPLLKEYSVDIYLERELHTFILRIILPVLLLALCCLLLGNLFYLIYKRSILTPLDELNSQVNQIIKGNYKEKINLSAAPEFDLLVDGLNGLTRLLEKNSYQVEHSRQILEQKLALRTKNLKSALDRLRRYNNNTRDSFYTTVHDLKTPLTIINGYASILLKYDNYSAKQREDFINKIHNEIMRLTNMLNTFLKSIKSDNSSGEMKFAKIELIEMLEYFYSIYEIQAKEMEVDFIWNITASLPPIYGDREKLEHVISNLLSNAFKFVNKGGIVKLNALEREGYVTLSVIDTGPGIKEGNEENIFNKFKKFKTDSNDNITGTGLGLYIAREIIKQHGGKIWAENNKGGQGCTFNFTVPIYKLSGTTSDCIKK